MFLTTRQRQVLDAQAPRQRSQQYAHERLGVTESTISSINHEIFKNFKEALELMADPDYFNLFERSFRKYSPDIWENTRLIRSQMKKQRNPRGR